uniref:Ig-like domain-containing protein n=1 Tax=Lates calcarifer TaxID=8187 RepID=A0A4W6DVT0_LATCA
RTLTNAPFVSIAAAVSSGWMHSPSLVSSITVSSPAEIHASKGDIVTLSCTFTSTSRPTSKMTVDWSYRPQTGGPPQTVSMHLFFSKTVQGKHSP